VAQDQEPGEPGCHADREGEARFLLPRPWSPLLIGEGSRLRGPLTDLAVDLAAKSAGFRRSLLPGVLTALADLVRSMNCYYSNLIEGHDTHPVDIERALKSDYSADPEKRDLQLEANALRRERRFPVRGPVLFSALRRLAAICRQVVIPLRARRYRVRQPGWLQRPPGPRQLPPAMRLRYGSAARVLARPRRGSIGCCAHRVFARSTGRLEIMPALTDI
jgi:hypothetical protein